MNRRAQASGVTLSSADAAAIKGMLHRGDRQHDIAAWFGVNGGRVAEIAVGAKFAAVSTASLADLPPRGPYPNASQALAVIASLAIAKNALAAAENTLQRLTRS